MGRCRKKLLGNSIGFIFGLGVAMGFIVGIVIVYQILYSDVSDRLAEYATCLLYTSDAADE